MRKILTILFLLPFFASAQITVTSVNSAFNSAGVGTVVGQAFVTGRLYIMYVGVSNNAGTPATVALTGTGQTWTLIDELVTDQGNHRIATYRFACVSSTTQNITFGYTGTQDGSWFSLLEVTGTDNGGTNGSNAIVQVVKDALDATADPTVTMAAISSTRNAVLFGFCSNANPPGGTPESGGVEDADNGYNTPTTGGYTYHRLSTTDNTPIVTAASSNWAAIGIELKSTSSSGFPIPFFF
jgi:hypothetical protein